MPLCQQLLPLAACRLQMALLDVAIAANVLGNACNLHGQRQIACHQLGQQPLDAVAVFGDQGTLGLALLGATRGSNAVPRNTLPRASH